MEQTLSSAPCMLGSKNIKTRPCYIATNQFIYYGEQLNGFIVGFCYTNYMQKISGFSRSRSQSPSPGRCRCRGRRAIQSWRRTKKRSWSSAMNPNPDPPPGCVCGGQHQELSVLWAGESSNSSLPISKPRVRIKRAFQRSQLPHYHNQPPHHAIGA